LKDSKIDFNMNGDFKKPTETLVGSLTARSPDVFKLKNNAAMLNTIGAEMHSLPKINN
jgi:hypothetical protein